MSELTAELGRRISKLESEITDDQVGIDIPAEERLREIELKSISNSETPGEVPVRIGIVNEMGRSEDVVL